MLGDVMGVYTTYPPYPYTSAPHPPVFQGTCVGLVGGTLDQTIPY